MGDRDALQGSLGSRAVGRMRVILWRCAALLASAILLSAAKPVATRRILPVSRWNSERFRFAFDLPKGWSADTSDAQVALIFPAGVAQFAFAVQVDDGPCKFEGPLANPKDTLVSYVKQRFTFECDFVGSDADRFPDALRSIRHNRSLRGIDVVEFASEIVEGPSGDFDSEEPADDEHASPKSRPDAAAKARETTHTFVIGPSFLVDLSRPGRPLRIWILPYCGDRTSKATVAAERVVLRSLRRI
jgi:hypothetical protein